jgi:hypothetical protein
MALSYTFALSPFLIFSFFFSMLEHLIFIYGNVHHHGYHHLAPPLVCTNLSHMSLRQRLVHWCFINYPKSTRAFSQPRSWRLPLELFIIKGQGLVRLPSHHTEGLGQGQHLFIWMVRDKRLDKEHLYSVRDTNLGTLLESSSTICIWCHLSATGHEGLHATATTSHASIGTDGTTDVRGTAGTTVGAHWFDCHPDYPMLLQSAYCVGPCPSHHEPACYANQGQVRHQSTTTTLWFVYVFHNYHLISKKTYHGALSYLNWKVP